MAKEATGGSPLPLVFALSATEFAQNAGKNYKIVLRHNVAGQDDEKVKGTVKVVFPIATVTVFDNSAKLIDLAGQGAKTEVGFAIPNKLGKLEVNIAFKDGLFNTKDLVAQLVRADGVSVNARSRRQRAEVDPQRHPGRPRQGADVEGQADQQRQPDGEGHQNRGQVHPELSRHGTSSAATI